MIYFNIKIYEPEADLDEDRPSRIVRGVGAPSTACSKIAGVLLELEDGEIADITAEAVESSDRSPSASA